MKVTQGGKALDAVSTDFSLTGLRLRLPQAVDQGQALDLAVYLPSENLERYENGSPCASPDG